LTTITDNFGGLVSSNIAKLRLPPHAIKMPSRISNKCISEFKSRILREFKDDGNEYYADIAVDFAHGPANIDGGYMLFSIDEVKICFEPVVQHILELFHDQLHIVQDQERRLKAEC
jgi:hypothetical protein